MEAATNKYFIPLEFRDFFEFEELLEKGKEWNLVLREKEGLVPEELRGKEAVLNGYRNPVEVIDFPFRGKLMYIKFYRRRWKEKGDNEKTYSNTYQFHPIGMKATKEFGDFLKALDRRELSEFFSAWKDIRYIREEDIRLVS